MEVINLLYGAITKLRESRRFLIEANHRSNRTASVSLRIFLQDSAKLEKRLKEFYAACEEYACEEPTKCE